MAAAAEVNPRGEPPQIPGYRIEGVLGRGATGTVYRARQLSVDRVVALKVLHPELAGAGQAVRRMQREAKTTARLSHPNIISAIDMGEVDGRWWYAMELVDGMSLAARLKEGPLSEREALRVFIPLVEALQHAFERGVVHRDIKPANILIERGGRALLVDLGLAFANDDPMLTKAGGTLGTPHYISPEQARDPAGADAQSDLWSLGATMYHAVCGRPPFSGDSVAEILSEVLYSKVPDPAQIAPHASSGLALVLRKCLTRDKRVRYAAPAELLADLERLRERRAPLVRRASLEPVARDWRWIGRVAGFTALTAAGLAGVWFIALKTGHEPQLSADTAPRGAVADAVDRLSGAVLGPAAKIVPALAEAGALESSPALQPTDRSRVTEIRARLYQRLETETWEFRRSFAADLDRGLERGDIEEAQDRLDRDLRRELAARVGEGPLPERIEGEIAAWSATLGLRVRTAREKAELSFAGALERHVVEKVLPRVDGLVARGMWRDARSLTSLDPSTWIADARIPTRGLSEAAVTHGVDAIRARIDARRESLDTAWTKLDGDLQAWVEQRVAALREDLAARTVQDAAGTLQADWTAELGARSLSIDQMPYGLVHQGYEELAKGKRVLSELEDQLATEDARIRLEEIEAEIAPLWRVRRYGEIAAAFESGAGEVWSLPVRPGLDLRAREAHALESLIVRAAEGVRAHDGEVVTLRQGTVGFSGRLAAGPDPLTQGFRIAPAEGKERVFALRAPGTTTVTATVCGAEAVEWLAGLSGGPDPRDNLLRALFRWREGDARGAQAALNAGPLPREDPLVAELESAVASALGREPSPQSQRRQRAVEKLRLLRREVLESASRDKKGKRIEEVLKYTDVLTSEEATEVRGLRDSLAAEARPSTLDELQQAFGLQRDSIDVVANTNRVVMHFDFANDRTGAFQKGTWVADGAGWAATRYAKNDDEMLDLAGPTLALKDPLRPAAGLFDVRLRFEPTGSSQPDLLLVSAEGFHVVVTGWKCLVDTGDAKDVVARARQDKGKALDKPRSKVAFDLHIVLNRERGAATVEVDGRKVVEGLFVDRRPTGDEKSLALSIRSFEPLRLVAATIEAARR